MSEENNTHPEAFDVAPVISGAELGDIELVIEDEAPISLWEFRTVAEVNLGTGRFWKAKVTFDIVNGFKPVDVTLWDVDSGRSVTLPIELWGLFADRIAEELRNA